MSAVIAVQCLEPVASQLSAVDTLGCGATARPEFLQFLSDAGTFYHLSKMILPSSQANI
jgi:hypothetical protein